MLRSPRAAASDPAVLSGGSGRTRKRVRGRRMRAWGHLRPGHGRRSRRRRRALALGTSAWGCCPNRVSARSAAATVPLPKVRRPARRDGTPSRHAVTPPRGAASRVRGLDKRAPRRSGAMGPRLAPVPASMAPPRRTSRGPVSSPSAECLRWRAKPRRWASRCHWSATAGSEVPLSDRSPTARRTIPAGPSCAKCPNRSAPPRTNPRPPRRLRGYAC
mmetsp:Transcript_99886/g.279761  ORF Transcript_99886/g.279761 Transcript_99886/m.279761 type:complete len:217 (-) Transcript_99886:374-1024(-)